MKNIFRNKAKYIAITCFSIVGVVFGSAPAVFAAGTCNSDECTASDMPYTYKCCMNVFNQCRIFERKSCYPATGFRYNVLKTLSGECVQDPTYFGGISDPDSNFCVVPTGVGGGG